jgi:pimeloyl-ACP methyl ester carboxylesterase
MPPETRYAKSGDVNIAYQVVGDGPFDLVYVPGWVSNVELFWEKSKPARLLERLASFSRLILFDKRGTGMSDRVSNDRLRDKIGGVAVHTGARVAAAADPGEVLVSSTVKDLVAGSGIVFADRGERELKGVGSWRLYSVLDA